jgi:hypothetical protein
MFPVSQSNLTDFFRCLKRLGTALQTSISDARPLQTRNDVIPADVLAALEKLKKK